MNNVFTQACTYGLSIFLYTDDDSDLFGPPPEEDDSPFGKGGGLFAPSSGGLFDDDQEDEVMTATFDFSIYTEVITVTRVFLSLARRKF